METPNQTNLQDNKRLPLDWDVLGLTSAAIALVGTAIFFISGWIYEAHWFSFFGVNISQLNPDPIRMMVQGIPGVLYFSSVFLVSTGIVIFLKRAVWDAGFQMNDMPYVILLAYVLSTLDLLTIISQAEHFYFKGTQLQLIPEVVIAVIPAVLIILYSVLAPLYYLLSKSGLLVPYYAPGLEVGLKYSLRFRKYVGIDFSLFSNEDIEKILKKFNEPSARRLERFTLGVIRVVSRTWKIWTFILIIFVFLVSIAFSALLGEYEARLGRRTLNGNWHLSEIYIYSNEQLGVLTHIESITSSGIFRYGPLSLIAEDDNMLFVVDWEESGHYVQRPNLYMIPYNDESGEIQLLLPGS